MNPRLLSRLGSDFGLPPWGEAPGTGSFEVRRDSEDLGYPRGKPFALGTVGCKPPWAGGQRSSTMDYLVGIFLLLCGVALPGRVAPQHTKENVPRLKLSYKGKFCSQTHHHFVMHTSFFTFLILTTHLIPMCALKLDSFCHYICHYIYLFDFLFCHCCLIPFSSFSLFQIFFLHLIYSNFALTDCFHVVFLHVLALLHNFFQCTVL